MSNVQFEEERQFERAGFTSTATGAPSAPRMARLLMRCGIREEKTATMVLIAIAIAAGLLSIFIFAREIGSSGDASERTVPSDAGGVVDPEHLRLY